MTAGRVYISLIYDPKSTEDRGIQNIFTIVSPVS